MASRSPFHTLFAYHWDTTLRLLDGAANLHSGEVKADPGYGRGSIHDVFFHILRTDQAWRVGLQTGRHAAAIEADAFPDLNAIRLGFGSERAEWQLFLDTLGEDDVQKEISLTNWHGEIMVLPRWRFLQHVILHGMQHHAELAQALTARGQSPGNIDFLFYS